MPGSWVGDTVEEYKKLPTAGKIAAIGGLLLVAGIGYYEYSKGKSSKSGVSGSASPSTDLSGAGANQYPLVPGGNTGQVPVLPGGLQPIFDGLGNLIGFQPIPPSTTPAPTPGPTPAPGPPKPPKPTKPPKKDKDGDQHEAANVGGLHGRLPHQPIQPPTGTPRGQKIGPGQSSRPIPPQPVRRRA